MQPVGGVRSIRHSRFSDPRIGTHSRHPCGFRCHPDRVARDFYATTAQVFPVLLLALVWESRFLERLRSQSRASRAQDPLRGFFWTKPRVRAWTLLVTGVTVTEIVVSVGVLSDAVPDHPAVRAVVCAGLVLVLATITTRAVVDIVEGTADLAPPPTDDPVPQRTALPDQRHGATSPDPRTP